MDIDKILAFISLLGVVQGLVMGLIFIISYKKKKASLFLGIFVIVYALNLLQDPLCQLGFFTMYPQYLMTPIYFYWSLFVFFYIYVAHISSLPKSKLIYLLLIPGLIEQVIGIVNTFKDIDTQWEIYRSDLYLHTIYGSMAYSIIIGLITIIHINKHIKTIDDYFSSSEKKELQWAKLYATFGIFFILIHLLLPSEIIQTDWFGVLSKTTNVALLYWVMIRGFFQKTVVLPRMEHTGKKESLDCIGRSKKTSKDKNDLSRYTNVIEDSNALILSKKLYVKPDLTIVDLASELDMHPKLVSQSINSILNQNFNTYINGFRIERAKEMLKEPKSDLSIDGIGLEAGFKSKSSFYTAFKKFTKTTPSKYKY